MTLRSAIILYSLFDVVYAILHVINDSQSQTLIYYDRTFHMLMVANIIMSVVPSLIGIFTLMALANNRKLRCTFKLYGYMKFVNQAIMLQFSNILLYTKEGGVIALLMFLSFSAFHCYGAYLLISSYRVLSYGLYDLFIGEAEEEEEEQDENEEEESPNFYLRQV